MATFEISTVKHILTLILNYSARLMDLVVIRFKNTKQSNACHNKNVNFLIQETKILHKAYQLFIQSSHFRFLLKTYSVVFLAETCC